MEQFFEEDEVEEWVSTLQQQQEQDNVSRVVEEEENEFEEIGIFNGTFKYSSDKTSAPTASGNKKQSTTNSGVGGGGQDEEVQDEEPEFELKGINVSFPKGCLSLISGPTGSGKSSLFLALLGGELDLPSLSLSRDSIDNLLTYLISDSFFFFRNDSPRRRDSIKERYSWSF